jgi:hypothetical protein
MRLSLISLIIVIATASIFAQKYVTPKEETGLYKNETRQVYEEPIQTVGPNDRLTILETKSRHYKVKTTAGEEGWVEKRLVAATGKSKTFVFDNAEVIGYLDNPTPVYIIDTDDPNADPINLDRSFKDALRENVDKETIERQVK